MPDLGKAVYTLVFDTREGEAAVAGIEARASQAGRKIAQSMGMAEKSVAGVGAATVAAGDEVASGTGEMTGGFEAASASAQDMAATVASANTEVALSSKAAAASTASAWSRAGAAMGGIGKQMKHIGRGLTHKVTLPTAIIGAVAVKSALDYTEQIKMLRTQAGATEGEMQKMNKQVLLLAQSGKVTHGPNDLAKALYHLESSGIRGAKAMDALRQADHLATVGGADLEATTDAVAKAFSSGIGGAQNFSTAVGTINATIGAGNMRLEDFNSAMGTGIYGAARAAGVPLRAVGAALATFTTSGLPAVQSMTAFRMSLTSLTKPTKAQIAYMKLLGYQQSELAKDIRTKGLIPTINDLSRRYDIFKKKHGTEAANKAFLGAFGGAKSAKAMLTLIQQSKRLGKNYDQIGEKTKDFAKLTAEAMGEPVNKMRANIAKMSASLIKIGNVLVPIVSKLVDGLSKVFQWFDKLSPKTQKFVLIAVGIAAAVGPILMIGGALASFIALGSGIPAIIALVAGGLTLLFIKSKTARMEMLKIWAAAKVAFSNIAALVMAVVGLIRKHWMQLAPIFHAVIRYLASQILFVLGFISRVFKIITQIVHGHWGAAMKGVVSLARWAVGQAAHIVWNLVLVWANVGKAVLSVVKGWMAAVINVVIQGLNWITGKLDSIKIPTGIKVHRHGFHISIEKSYSHPFKIGKIGKVNFGGGSGPSEVIGDHGGGSGKAGKTPPKHGGTKPPKGVKAPKINMPDLGAGGFDAPNADIPSGSKKKKKKKKGASASLGGAYDAQDARYQDRLDIIEAKIATAKTKRAKAALLKQEMGILNAEESYLKRKLKAHGLSLKKQAQISREITAIEKKKLELAKKTKKQSDQLGKEYQAVLETRGTFFAEFAGSIFGKSSGGLTVGGESASTQNVNVNQTNHYNEIPKNRYAAARSMQRAASEAMSGL